MRPVKDIQLNNNGEKAYFFRLYIAGIISGIFAILVLLKAFYIQFFENDYYSKLAQNQYKSKVTVQAPRGIVYDRYMNKLAVNLFYYSLAADPKLVEKHREIAKEFSLIFGKSEEYYFEKLKQNTRFVWLERLVSEEQAQKIGLDKYKGIIEIRNLRRNYPYGKVAGQLIGFTNVDNVGAGGIEVQFDEILKGEDGWRVLQRTGLGELNPNVKYPKKDPIKGGNVTLTIDVIYQSIVEEELNKTVSDLKAKGGVGILMNPYTGEILAMASVPSFDPNQFNIYNDESRKNRAISDAYEPGSGFKIVATTAILEEKIKSPTDLVFCENGKFKFYDRTFTDHEKYGFLTFKQVIEYSSNIGMLKIANSLGKDKLYRYTRAYGFGELTNLGLAGEARGKLQKPSEWSGVSIASISIGYEVAVTPLQLVNAYCAIANGGFLLKPIIIKEVRDKKDKIVEKSEPEIIRRVASKKTTIILKELLEGVVERGTAKKIFSENLRIAGKTGTARKLDENLKIYESGQYVSSFIGMYPVDEPRIVGIIMIDAPQGLYYGSDVAAPTFKRIMERIVSSPNQIFDLEITELDREPDIFEDKIKEDKIKGNSKYFYVPDVRNLNIDIAKELLEGKDIDVNVEGEGDIVIYQEPDAGKKFDKKPESIKLTVVELGNNNNNFAITPNVIGLSVREAINRLALENLDAKIYGSGVVVRQNPKPGTKIASGRKCVLECMNN